MINTLRFTPLAYNVQLNYTIIMPLIFQTESQSFCFENMVRIESTYTPKNKHIKEANEQIFHRYRSIKYKISEEKKRQSKLQNSGFFQAFTYAKVMHVS